MELTGVCESIAAKTGAGRIRVLLVEPRRRLAAVMARYLEGQEFAVDVAHGEADALRSFRDIDPDIIVVGTSSVDGGVLEMARQLRTLCDPHFIVVTDGDFGMGSARDSSMAGERVSRPYSSPELVTRIRRVLRQPRKVEAETPNSPTDRDPRYGTVGALDIDLAARRVHVVGEPVTLTRIEFDLLARLFSHPGEVVSRRQLHDSIWGRSWVGNRNTLDVHIGNLRRKLGDDPIDPRYVITVRGVGFRLRI